MAPLLKMAYERGIDPFAIVAKRHVGRGEHEDATLAEWHSLGWGYVLAGRCTLYVDAGNCLWFAMSPEALAELRETCPDQEDVPHAYRKDVRVVALP